MEISLIDIKNHKFGTEDMNLPHDINKIYKIYKISEIFAENLMVYLPETTEIEFEIDYIINDNFEDDLLFNIVIEKSNKIFIKKSTLSFKYSYFIKTSAIAVADILFYSVVDFKDGHSLNLNNFKILNGLISKIDSDLDFKGELINVIKSNRIFPTEKTINLELFDIVYSIYSIDLYSKDKLFHCGAHIEFEDIITLCNPKIKNIEDFNSINEFKDYLKIRMIEAY